MATLALLYDIHGNLPALEAVLEDARAQEADRFLLGGDYALFGPWPSETVSTLRALPEAACIRGNVDRWSAAPEQAPDDEVLRAAISACREALGARVARELGELEEQVVLDDTLYCHASPISDVRSFMPDAGDEDDELIGSAEHRRVVFGHTHLQFRRTHRDGVELVNPGSVGMPLDADQRAAYALVRDDGSLELRRIGYDHEASAAAAEERFPGAAWAQRTARRLRAARLVE